MARKRRRKRFQRRDQPPPMRLTARDRAVIEAVYHYRVLDTGQIRRLLFDGKDRRVAERRLALLYDHGYLERRRPGGAALPGPLNAPVLYLLGERGSRYLIRHTGYDEVRWKPADNAVGDRFLEHLLATNTFRVEVTLACRAAGYRLVRWLDDATLKGEYDRVVVPGEARPVPVIPDGYFAVETPRGRTHFFLELDRGTMESKRYKRKVRAYQAYRRGEAMGRRFGTHRARVLTVTMSTARATNLKAASEGVGGSAWFWFGVLDELAAPAVLDEPVWWVAGRDQRSVLVRA